MLKFAALAAFVMNLLAFLWGFVCVSVPGNFPAVKGANSQQLAVWKAAGW